MSGRPAAPALVGPLAAARVLVADVEAARAFHGGMLGPAERVGDETMTLHASGPVDLLVERQDPADPEEGALVGLSVHVPDAAAAHARIEAAGADLLGPPERRPWGGALLHVRHVSGHAITLLEPPGGA